MHSNGATGRKRSILDENTKSLVSDATVLVKGTNRQTLTNQNGKFSIEPVTGMSLSLATISFMPMEINAAQPRIFRL
jgi:hypothetical protein